MTKGTHLFPYIQIGNYHRPIIPLFLRVQDITVEYHVLVDSGADFNLFHTDIAEIFGIDLEHADTERISGIGGEVTAYPFLFEMSLDQHTFSRSPALLSSDLPMSYGIVGQVGFFDKFSVEFTYKTKQIALTAL